MVTGETPLLTALMKLHVNVAFELLHHTNVSFKPPLPSDYARRIQEHKCLQVPWADVMQDKTCRDRDAGLPLATKTMYTQQQHVAANIAVRADLRDGKDGLTAEDFVNLLFVSGAASPEVLESGVLQCPVGLKGALRLLPVSQAPCKQACSWKPP